MLERIQDIPPFDYGPLISYLKQFPSVTFVSPGDRRNFFVHQRASGRKAPVRDLDGQQLRLLLESFGIKVYSRVNDAATFNWAHRCDNYIEKVPDDSLIVVFPLGNFVAGENGDIYAWFKNLFASGRPYLWVYNDVRMDPNDGNFARFFSQIAESKTIGMMDGSTFHVNYNVDMLKFTSKQPSINKFCYIGGKRKDTKKRMRCFKPDNTSCYGLCDKVENGFYFEYELPPNRIVDAYSTYVATIFSTSANSVLGNMTPRLYETLCSNAVVLFDVESDLEFDSWEFRKVSNSDEAAERLQYLVDHPDYRQQLVNEQHGYIKRLDEHINSTSIVA